MQGQRSREPLRSTLIISAAVSQETVTRKSQPGFMAATSELLDAWMEHLWLHLGSYG